MKKIKILIEITHGRVFHLKADLPSNVKLEPVIVNNDYQIIWIPTVKHAMPGEIDTKLELARDWNLTEKDIREIKKK